MHEGAVPRAVRGPAPTSAGDSLEPLGPLQVVTGDVAAGGVGDVLDGGPGTDVLIGGSGDDVLLNREVVFDV